MQKTYVIVLVLALLRFQPFVKDIPESIDLNQPNLYLLPGNTNLIETINLRADDVELLRVEARSQEDGSAQSFVIESVNVPVYDEQNGFRYYFLEGLESVFIPRVACNSFEGRTFQNPQTGLFDLSLTLTGTVALEAAGFIANGQLSDRYRFTKDNLRPDNLLGLTLADDEFGYLYVTRIGGYINRLEFRGSGSSMWSGESPTGYVQLDLIWSVKPFSHPIPFEAAVDCSWSEFETKHIPLIPLVDAFKVVPFEGNHQYGEVTQFAQGYVFYTYFSLEEVKSIYHNQLTTLGYPLQGEEVYPEDHAYYNYRAIYYRDVGPLSFPRITFTILEGKDGQPYNEVEIRYSDR